MASNNIITVGDLSADFSIDATGIVYISDAALGKIQDAILNQDNFEYLYDVSGNCVGSVAKMCPAGSTPGSSQTPPGTLVDLVDLSGNRLGSMFV